MAMIHADGRSHTVWYSGVTNWSARYNASTQPRRPACAVICLDCAGHREKWDQYRSIGGRATVHDYIVVFSAEGRIANSSPAEPANQ
jgi:hypothetical protein